MKDTSHDPRQLFHSNPSSPANSTLIILNQPIPSQTLLTRLYHTCPTRICADGGANRLYDLFAAHDASNAARKRYLPTAIHGDLDSLRDNVARFYRDGCGVPVTRDEDQYSTDFGKAVSLALKRRTDAKSNSRGSDADQTLHLVILGSLGGRVDQGLGTLSEMARHESRLQSSPASDEHGVRTIQFWLVSEVSVSLFLEAGCKHTIYLGFAEKASGDEEEQNSVFTPNVGILPIFGPARISTEGLEWDVRDWETRMGGAVSTSNHAVGEAVVVEVAGGSGLSGALFTVERNTAVTG